MNRLLFSLLLGSVCLAGAAEGLLAQNPATQPLPPPPYMAELPASSQWTVTMDEKELPKPGAPVDQLLIPESVVTTKTPKGRLDVIKFTRGTEQDRWLVDGYEITKALDTGAISIRRLSIKPDANWVTGLDLSELSWVKTAKPSWPTKGGGQGLYFEGDVVNPSLFSSDLAYAKTTVKVKAWIDPKTKLPLAYNDGAHTYHYTFQTSPTGDVDLPPDVAERLQKYINRHKALY